MYVNIRINRIVQKLIAAVLVTAIATAVSGVFYSGKGETVVKEKDGINVPVLMYHSLLKDPALQGKYVIHPDRLEEDLKYITENGYTTVTIADLVNYVYAEGTLPEKPVMLTFDDGHYNNYFYAYPLLQQYGCKAILSPIGAIVDEYTENGDISPTYGYCSWDVLKEMSESGHVEIQNHSYDMHCNAGRKGANIKYNESREDYKNNLSEDLLKAQELIKKSTGKAPLCFTYPLGAKSEISEETIKELGFKASLCCLETVNVITKDKDCLYSMGRFLRNNTDTAKTIFERMEKQYA